MGTSEEEYVEICGGKHISLETINTDTIFECDKCGNRIIIPYICIIPMCIQTKKDIRNKKINDLLNL